MRQMRERTAARGDGTRGWAPAGYSFDFDADAARVYDLLRRRVSQAASVPVAECWCPVGEASEDPHTMTPLRRAAIAFELTPAEYEIVLLAAMVEIDGDVIQLVRHLDPLQRARPTLALALTLAGSREVSPFAILERPLVRRGLIDVEGDGPIADRLVKIDPDVARRLVSDSLDDLDLTRVSVRAPDPDLVDRLVLAPGVHEEKGSWLEQYRNGTTTALLLVGEPRAGRSTIAHAIATELGVPLVVASPTRDDVESVTRAAVREACWCGAFLAIRIPAETPDAMWDLVWRQVAVLRSPYALCVSAPPPRCSTQKATVIEVPGPTAAQRVQLWRHSLGTNTGIDDGALERIAWWFRFPPGLIRQIAREAAGSVGDQAHRFDEHALRRACAAEAGAEFGPLAQRISTPYTRDDLVLPTDSLAELDLALAWVRRGHEVLERWEMERHVPYGRGLAVLFAGPPGTGKTMAARVMARELGLALCRIDLSRVVSKYIGETEKNLAALFDRARMGGAILFFDEADALFGKRTATQDAHDRYANLEVAYLLQRIESHDGITILASNLAGNVDRAFVRRFQSIVRFPMPAAEHRELLWERMLRSSRLPVDENVDIRALSEGFELSGGEIRNAAIAAAFLAAEEGGRVGVEHLRQAIGRELKKKGAVVDPKRLRALGGHSQTRRASVR